MYHFRVQELESRSEVRHRPATRGCRGRPDGLRSQDLGEAGCDAALLCNGGVFMNARSFLALAGLAVLSLVFVPAANTRDRPFSTSRLAVRPVIDPLVARLQAVSARRGSSRLVPTDF